MNKQLNGIIAGCRYREETACDGGAVDWGLRAELAEELTLKLRCFKSLVWSGVSSGRW